MTTWIIFWRPKMSSRDHGPLSLLPNSFRESHKFFNYLVHILKYTTQQSILFVTFESGKGQKWINWWCVSYSISGFIHPKTSSTVRIHKITEGANHIITKVLNSVRNVDRKRSSVVPLPPLHPQIVFCTKLKQNGVVLRSLRGPTMMTHSLSFIHAGTSVFSAAAETKRFLSEKSLVIQLMDNIWRIDGCARSPPTVIFRYAPSCSPLISLSASSVFPDVFYLPSELI